MMLSNFLRHLLPRGRRGLRIFVGPQNARINVPSVLDVRSLEPSSPMSAASKAERYRTGRFGRFAEMTDSQAGL